MVKGAGGTTAASGMRLAAAATALGSAAVTLLALALGEARPGRLAVLAAVGAALLALSGLSALAALVGALAPEAAAAPAAAPPAPPGGGALPKILDTSVIIDGRVADVCETGFLEGTLLVPQFVLRELQYIADSPDPLKRNRGRRGLDVLSRLQKRSNPPIVVTDRDFPLLREVDAKLVALARESGALIVSNDVNLTKVAELNGVPVLNLNQLASALKPVALPGEVLRVTVLKEGKEPTQGVAYLEDGTMIVVENGRRHLGRSLEVAVTSAIQTSAGRMIFAQPRETARDAATPAAEGEP